MNRAAFRHVYRETRKLIRFAKAMGLKGSASTLSIAAGIPYEVFGCAYRSTATDQLGSVLYRFRDLRKYRITGPRGALP